MMVATRLSSPKSRHEMPGKSTEMIRPVGNGMIDRRGRRFVLNGGRSVARHDHTVPFLRRHPGYGGQDGTGFSTPLFQAFHAWLPSCRPSGTIYLPPNVESPNP